MAFEALAVGRVPSVDEVKQPDLFLIVGPIAELARSHQLAGVLSLAVPDGAVAVLAYHRTLPGESAIVVEFTPSVGIRGIGGPFPVTQAHPAMLDYLRVFGLTETGFENLPADAEVLGTTRDGVAVAWCIGLGRGAFYVLPYLVAGASGLAQSLIESVIAHRAGSSDVVPAYLGHLRLFGEADVLTSIDNTQAELADLLGKAGWHSRFRLLLGGLSGDPFEALVIDALNTVLEGTEYCAEDREELRAEDFWVVAGERDAALAEAKGVGRHVRREDVNQVDNHRAELGRDVDELPGLLVMNVFRGDESLEQRELPVSDDVVRQAERLNVLVLRSVDLYRLVSRKLANPDSANELIKALEDGGGWLEVTDTDVTLKKG